MPCTILSDRAVLLVSGQDAAHFLNSVMTCAVETLPVSSSQYGALLTPQGKIIADFILYKTKESSFFLDVDKKQSIELIKRLSLYKLRSLITISDVTDKYCILVGWGENIPIIPAIICAPDPRLSTLGWRGVYERTEFAGLVPEKDYHVHRMKQGIPEGDKDFDYLDTFPHEALMDQLGGVNFEKGCYIGQEVVSRMQHRGQIKTRVMPILYSRENPLSRSLPVQAGEKIIGKTGTCAKGYGFAMIRLDQADSALKEGLSISAGGNQLTFEKYPWMSFAVPGF